ncbi:MAG: 2-oxoacid:acceptor oxidoreductase subunit alpha, partial [Rhodothermaceae bacterium]|nr:2-oxoacid:acceptor oxidoreductase subunit alpha [Rhodothermaceae bacterium]
CKNMFILGIIYWLYSRSLDATISFIEKKFGNKPEIAAANIKALQDGYTFGNATQLFSERYSVDPAKIDPGNYRNITGNEATVIGLTAATKKSGLKMFFGSYPITPASDILHGLARMKHFDVYTFQAEDEISAVTSSIGAAFGGNLAVTCSSGPGIALKTEAISLATILELPLVIINVQRAGPSTGMPTKTEQADLLQAVYGRAGECPLVVVAARSPADCFDTIYEACKIALEHMVPVMFLSDGYIANGAEPWKYPSGDDLAPITVAFDKPRDTSGEAYKPYVRDENLVRPWAIPGTKGLEHRIGGLEKEHETGNISYDPDNHQLMTEIREKKRDLVAGFLPPVEVEVGDESGDLLVIGWGSTFGSIKQAVLEAREEGYSVTQVHLRHISPFPSNLEEVMKRYKKVLIPEINSGQLLKLIRDKFLLPAEGYNRVRGVPFSVEELKNAFIDHIESSKS